MYAVVAVVGEESDDVQNEGGSGECDKCEEFAFECYVWGVLVMWEKEGGAEVWDGPGAQQIAHSNYGAVLMGDVLLCKAVKGWIEKC